jgi:hypothetical protein
MAEMGLHHVGESNEDVRRRNAASAPTEAEDSAEEYDRLKAEQAVLDACQALKLGTNECGPPSRLGKPVILSGTSELADAIAAWRALKP